MTHGSIGGVMHGSIDRSRALPGLPQSPAALSAGCRS